MMKIVHELEELGWVKRRVDPADSRAKLIAFSPQGEQLLAQLDVSTQVVWEQYAKQLGVEALDTLLESLRLMVSPPHCKGNQ
jgi:MarR family transcriptional regulator for hemolysin